MDSYVQTWLLFAFPAYLIALMVVIILLCKYSSRVTQIIGKINPVATLTTLLLLFYTKLLQIIITVLLFARFNECTGVWNPRRLIIAISLQATSSYMLLQWIMCTKCIIHIRLATGASYTCYHPNLGCHTQCQASDKE